MTQTDENSNEMLDVALKQVVNEEKKHENMILNKETGELFKEKPTFFISPNNIKVSRTKKRRAADPNSWQEKRRKKARLAGQGFYDRKGKLRPMKIMKPGCKNCRLNCMDRVALHIRTEFFEKYYQLKSNRLK